MGRPKKVLGNAKSINCAQCNSETLRGYRMSCTLGLAEVTPDFFIAYDNDIADYDAFFCSKKCALEYLKEELQDVT